MITLSLFLFSFLLFLLILSFSFISLSSLSLPHTDYATCIASSLLKQFFRYKKTRNQISDQTPDVPGASALNSSANDLNVTHSSVDGDTSQGKHFKNTARNVMNSMKAAGAMYESRINVNYNNDNYKLNASNNRVLLVSSSQNIDTLTTTGDNVIDKNTLHYDANGFDDHPYDVDGNNGINGNFEEVDMDKIETATADVIVNEYPVDCFPDKWYDRCPWCLEETPFMLKWRELRYHSYNLVENKYFETLCITLILISSMTLVSTLRFLCHLFFFFMFSPQQHQLSTHSITIFFFSLRILPSGSRR